MTMILSAIQVLFIIPTVSFEEVEVCKVALYIKDCSWSVAAEFCMNCVHIKCWGIADKEYLQLYNGNYYY